MLGRLIVVVEGFPVDINVIRNGDLLTDNEINAAQALLRKQYPQLGGLQDTLLGKSSSPFSPMFVS